MPSAGCAGCYGGAESPLDCLCQAQDGAGCHGGAESPLDCLRQAQDGAGCQQQGGGVDEEESLPVDVVNVNPWHAMETGEVFARYVQALYRQDHPVRGGGMVVHGLSNNFDSSVHWVLRDLSHPLT